MKKTKNKGLFSLIKTLKLRYLIIIIMAVLIFISAIIMNYLIMRNSIKTQLASEGKLNSVTASERFVNALTMGERYTNLATFSLETYVTMDSSIEDISNYLKIVNASIQEETDPDFDGFYAYYKGELINVDGWVPPANFMPTSRAWYKKAVENPGKTVLVEPYVDADTGKRIITVARCISDGKTIIATDIFLDKIKDFYHSMYKDDSSANRSFIISDTGYIVIANEPEWENTNAYNSDGFLSGLEPDYIGKDYYECQYDKRGMTYDMYFKQLYDGWYAVTAICLMDAMSMQNYMNIVEILSILAVFIVLTLLIRHIITRNEETESLNKRLRSTSDIYAAVFSVDLVNNQFDFVKSFIPAQDTNEKGSPVYDDSFNAREYFTDVVEKCVDTSYLMTMREFIDFSTLNDRMANENTITTEFMAYNHIYYRGRFIVEERLPSGEIAKVIWAVEDIDKEKKKMLKLEIERRKAEEQRYIAESERKHAQQANEAKNAFLSNMSHEIRTPINTIIGMNEMILREADSDQIRTYAENARVSSAVLMNIVNDILDFSKIEAGMLDIVDVDYDSAVVLNDIVNMIRSKIEDKGVSFHVRIDPDLPLILHGDEVRLKQIIMNLLSNAAKYTEKGSVTMTVRSERIAGENAVILIVSVKDTGIGIKEDEINKLFTAFERIDEKRNRTIAGIGLGMNITKQLLDLMGGELDINSVYGEGSEFTASVKQTIVNDEPIGDFESRFNSAVVKGKIYQEKFIAPNAKLLIVDDTPMNLTVAVNLLKNTHMQIDTAESGQACLNMTRNKKYDIIFLDHRMPEKDGIETLHELKEMADNPNLKTPVVCLTANALTGARQEYIEAGFDDYLPKPIDPEKFEEMILHYLPSVLVQKIMVEEEDENDKVSCIPDFVHNIKEINFENGRSHFPSDEMYLDVMKTYAENAPEYIEQIETMWGAHDIRNLTIKVHALKSTSRSIGALEIGELAQKLETAGHKEDMAALEGGLFDLVEMVRTLVEKLEPLKEAVPDDSELPPISEEELGTLYSQLKEHLDAFDFDSAEKVVTRISGHRVPEGEKERCSKLKKALDDFDFEAMIEIMEE